MISFQTMMKFSQIKPRGFRRGLLEKQAPYPRRKCPVDYPCELNRYAEVALLYLKVTQIFKGF